MKKSLAVLVLPCVALVALPGAAEAGTSRASATLTVGVAGEARAATSSSFTTGSSLVFGGCGYAPGADVNVTVQSPTANTFFGATADGDGCFSSSGIVTYVVQDAGSYKAMSFQSSRRADAAVAFSVAP